jgi:hypothetical protein
MRKTSREVLIAATPSSRDRVGRRVASPPTTTGREGQLVHGGVPPGGYYEVLITLFEAVEELI